MKTKRVFLVLLTVLIVATMLPIQSFAWFSYDRDQVVSNAHTFVPGYYGVYPVFNADADCTNYVSICEYSGNAGCGKKYNGVHDVSLLEWAKGYSIQDKPGEWYLVQKNVKKCFVTCPIWCASQSWTRVIELRRFNYNYNPQGCSTSVHSYSIVTAQDVLNLCSALYEGDIVQKGDEHSIIITVTGNNANDVRYCGHSASRYDKDLKYFIDDCKKDAVYSVYVIHYN